MPYRIIYTKHAAERLDFRRIKRGWVESAIARPDRLVDAKLGRKRAVKNVDSDKISMIYIREGSAFVIVTVYWGE